MTMKRVALLFSAAGLLAGCETPPVAPQAPAPGTNAATPGPEPTTTSAPPATPAVPAAPASPAAQQQAQKTAMQAVEMLEDGNEEQAKAELQRALALDGNNKLALNLMRQINADPQTALGRESFAYTVRQSDTLSRIAGRFLGDIYAFYILARYNDIKVPKQVAGGQVIRIPGKAPPPGAAEVPPRPPREHVATPPPAPVPTPPAPAPAPVAAPVPPPPVAPPPPAPPPAPPPPTAAELAFRRGDAAERAGRLDAAYEEFQAAAAQSHPGAAARAAHARSVLISSRLRAAREAMANQNPKAAIPLYDRVLALDPGNDTAKLERQRAVALVNRTGGN